MVPIPGGVFMMGDHSGIGVYDELPIHLVNIDAFHMDTFEVTCEEYCTYLNSAWSQDLIEVSGGVVYKKNDTTPYCDTTTSSIYSRITWDGSVFDILADKETHPMTEVSWFGALAYANWRSSQERLTPCYDLDDWVCTFGAEGYRLPTEAEWERAARGVEHPTYHDYPWGDSIDGSKANYKDSGDPWEPGNQPDTTPVGYYDGNQVPPGVDMINGFGLYDMAGNVYEWCNDRYDIYYYRYCLDHGIYTNPTGPTSGLYRVFRGGEWSTGISALRCANRSSFEPSTRFQSVGFRLVRDIP